MSCFVDTTTTSEATSTTDRSFTSSSTPTSTTIYTLPSPTNIKMMNSKTTTNNNKTSSSYEEFPKPSSASSSSTPSLPWFVEYWSSSLFNTPIMEKMFQCNGNERDVLDTSTSNMRLRQMVASRTMFDIDDGYNDDTLMSDASTSRYPIKNNTKRFPSIRKSSILQDDEEEDVASILDQAMTIIKDTNHPMMEDDHDDDDDTRDGIASVCSHKSVLDDYSSRMLYTCESFDQFLRGSTKSSHVVRLQPRPILGDDALMSTTTPMATPSRPNQQQRLHPPSSPSATTYTTVSMTQSYMHEDSLFDDDSEFGDDNNDDEQENQDMTTNDDDFLHRWNEKSSKLFRGLEDKTNDPYMTPPHHTSSRKRSLFAEPPAAPMKKQLGENDNDDQDHTEPYRYLIRMKPQNYLHHGSVEETKYDENDDDMYSLPSHLQLSSNMTFHEAFFMNNHKVLDIESKQISSTPPPVMPEF